MRIWHETLIPYLCRQHLLAMWREGLGCYQIVTRQVDGGSYKDHPAVKEFWQAPNVLYQRLEAVRAEMLQRGYHPKELSANPNLPDEIEMVHYLADQWQTLEQQVEILKNKACDCRV